MYDKNKGHSCASIRVAWWLIIIGGFVHGLRGLGVFLGMELDPVQLILGAWPMLAATVYVVVGIATVYKLMGCKHERANDDCDHCAECSNGKCTGHESKDSSAKVCDKCVACTPNCTGHEWK